MTTQARPLTGLTLLEVGSSGPLALDLAIGFCGRIAADLGAHVIRVAERGGAAAQSTEAERIFLHSAKQNMSVAVLQRDELVRELAATADAIVCDATTQIALSSHGVKVPIACIGMSIDSPAGGSEFTVEARSGLLDLVGDPGRQPLRLAGHPLAYTAGTAIYLAMITAILQKIAGEAPGAKRVDLLDIGVWLNWKTLGLALRRGRIPTRAGSASEWFIVPCADGYVALVYRVQEWEALKQATGDPRLLGEEFSSVEQRRAHRTKLNVILSDIFSRMTRKDIRALSLKFKLPLGPVWTPAELLADSHMVARTFFHPVAVDDRNYLMPRLPVVWNGAAFPTVVKLRSASA